MMPQPLTFHPTLVLRAPSHPFNSQFDEAFIRQRLLTDGQFIEALYLASPALYQECIKWRDGKLTDPKRIEKLRHSLVKYYCRTSSRCTPFGLFAGYQATRWEPGPDPEAAYSRHTRLDMQYLCTLAEHLAAHPSIRARLRYFPNSSRYQIGDEVRYIEYRYEDDVRLYQISSVTASKYLLHALAAAEKGLEIAAIAGQLLDLEAGLTEEDCLDFTDQLVDSQLLMSELEPSVTGKDFLRHILDVLGRIGTGDPDDEVTAVVTVLEGVAASLHALDASVQNEPARYEQIARELETLAVPLARHRLFQVDLSGLPYQPQLPPDLQASLLEAVRVLSVLTPKKENPPLETFKTLFADRYGDQEVPLLDVLDQESGIGYSAQGTGINTALTEDLVLTTTEHEEHVIGHHEAQRFIYRKLLEAQKNGSYEVSISPEEVGQITPPAELFPPSLSVLFRLTSAGTVLLEGAAGSSAVNLLGRFAHGNPGVADTIRQVTLAEQQTNPAVVFAEVSHLPQSRTGNILTRPAFRTYEIPYLAQSSLPADAQLQLSDLFVSYSNGRIVLRSRRLNREVVPRLATAHNFAHQSLPVYHFLCDLQAQDLQSSLYFAWDPVPAGIGFLPRVTYKNLVLHQATWNFTRRELQDLLQGTPATLADRLTTFRNTWRLPRLFTLADGDNELLVDADNLLTVRAWLDTIKNYDTVQLKEFLFDPAGSAVTDARGRPYVNQFIALLLNEKPCYQSAGHAVAFTGTPQRRKFWFGSEWMYYKLYCGVKFSDRILLEAIQPLAARLEDRGLIDKWFFIRYSDPSTHLRVRFHLADVDRIAEVMRLVNETLLPYAEKGIIWKMQLDTYVRELERYGYRLSEMSETLFCRDGVAAIAILEQTMGDDQEHLRWLWGVRSVDELLNAFGYGLSDKQLLIGLMKDSFAREFGMNKDLKLQLDAKYRTNKTLLSQFLNPDGNLAFTHPEIFAHLHQRNACAADIARCVSGPRQQQQLGVNPDHLISSHVHMLLNRLIPDNQRLHEMVIYDFLFRQYQGQAAMMKQ